MHLVAIALLFAISATSTAQPYPNRPLRFIVPYPPGGGSDFMARALAPKLAESLGQPVVIDNRPGAGATIGTALGAQAPADGYTLVLGTPAPISLARGLYPQLPYDPIADFAAVTLISTVPSLLVVHPSLPVKSVRELIGHAKANPGKLSYSSSGIGGAGHRSGAMFSVMAGVKMVHVPYRGTSMSVVGVLTNEAQLTFGDMVAFLAHARTGKLRALAVTSAQRSAVVPELPTVAESGLAGFLNEGWFGVLVPARTPASIINFLNTHVRKTLSLPDVREKYVSHGAEVFGTSPREFTEYMKAEERRWAKIIKQTDIRAE